MKTKLPCPKCGGLRTSLHGLNKSGSQRIGCRDCGTQRVPPKPPLSTIKCNHCEKIGINYRSPTNLCKNCYFQQKRDVTKIRNYLVKQFINNPDLIPINFNLSEFVDYLYIVVFRKGNKKLSESVIKTELLNYQKLISKVTHLERVELSSSVLETDVLPLN